MPPEPFTKPPDFCELHPNNPKCQNQPDLPMDGTGVLITMALIFAFMKLRKM